MGGGPFEIGIISELAAKGPKRAGERTSISSVEMRSVSLPRTGRNAHGTSYAAGFELSARRRGFIVQPEVIPMLIPLCPRDGPGGYATAGTSRARLRETKRRTFLSASLRETSSNR